ncbi:hypothetical protein G173_gp184 [Erwinia phage phiEaH2]|uniref:Uncharacterized protein n=1 Tax=Erwinia phage phiEaH2 TaxID=1029988 RepID=J7KE60_9CAUD|nr:hypothetical protein G173_gp184 [Erwinia phage phiEaH2]AFQ96729.1 hypothetical protein [Erwinia phage phiEaH2]
MSSLGNDDVWLNKIYRLAVGYVKQPTENCNDHNRLRRENPRG